MLKKWWIILTLPLQFVFIQWAKRNPSWVEVNYSQSFYPKVAILFRKLLGWIPFSVGDIFYSLVAISIVAFIWKKIRTQKVSCKEVVFKTLKLISIVYFFFHLLWGLNYYRQPLHKVLDLDYTYTTRQLEEVVVKLTQKSNTHHRMIVSNDSIKGMIPYTNQQIFEHTIAGYKELQTIFPSLDYRPKSIKESMFSKVLIYMGFSGYFNPFTSEAQVSRLVIPYKMPTTASHEEAHQLGFAKENEANFIGSLACMHNPDLYFQYSGYSFALRYCINDLYKRDEEKGICALEKINKGTLKNWEENRDFWLRYENPLEPLFKVFYSRFLKANNQSRGIKTYSYVVALFVNYFQKELSIATKLP